MAYFRAGEVTQNLRNLGRLRRLYKIVLQQLTLWAYSLHRLASMHMHNLSSISISLNTNIDYGIVGSLAVCKALSAILRGIREQKKLQNPHGNKPHLGIGILNVELLQVGSTNCPNSRQTHNKRSNRKQWLEEERFRH